jgi:hypothetical protein
MSSLPNWLQNFSLRMSILALSIQILNSLTLPQIPTVSNLYRKVRSLVDYGRTWQSVFPPSPTSPHRTE